MTLSLNGKTKYNGTRLSIYWTGQNAEHISLQHMEMPEQRPGIMQTQKYLQIAVSYKLPNGRIMGIVEKSASGFSIRIIWEKKSTFAVIKTSQQFSTTLQQLLKSKGIGKTTASKKKKLQAEDIPLDEIAFAIENGITADQYVKILNQHINKKR